MERIVVVIADEQHPESSANFELQEDSYEIIHASSYAKGLKACQTNSVKVVILEMNIGEDRGHALIKQIREINEGTRIVVIGDDPDLSHIQDVLKLGIYDYVVKPVNQGGLRLTVHRAMEAYHLARMDEVRYIKEKSRLKPVEEAGEIIGLGPDSERYKDLMRMASTSDVPVLLTGETGTGKSTLAKIIHTMHGDKGRPFVGFNCAALPESLIEAELFGHERGAFTGAISSSKGLFALAEGGTLFLDEIGEIPFSLQSKLLGVLDDGVYKRLGSDSFRKAHVRIIAATNVDIEASVNEKRFRSDLLYRLNVLHFEIPLYEIDDQNSLSF